MLDKFFEAKKQEILALRSMTLLPWDGKRSDFKGCISQLDDIALIAEYKRSSPSCGVIRHDLCIEEIANQYNANGANAISILTEEKYFDGDINFLHRAHNKIGPSLPILRKDFIFDEIQIRHTATTPASALLLIVRMMPNARKLRDLKELAEHYGIQSVIEIFNENDLNIAREAGAEIIQVNARDLATLHVDQTVPLKLVKQRSPNEIWIAASGISKAEDLRKMKDAGFNAALIGTSIMAAPNPGEFLASLKTDKCNVN